MAAEVFTFADLQRWPPDETALSPIRLAVLGNPVAHSLSPRMQNAALVAAGIAERYAAFEILPNELEAALRKMRELGFIGVNLTVPHKTAGFLLVEDKDEFSQAVGAINTIRFDPDKMAGCNTDGLGFARAITEVFSADLQNLRVLVLGAGGGGAAVMAEAVRANSRQIFLANRSLTNAQQLAARWPEAPLKVIPWKRDSLGEAATQTDLIVQATSLGLQPDDPSPLPRGAFQPRHLVYDLVYGRTRFLADAAAAGARHASGLTMLLHQGALAFEFWFQKTAPLAAMRAALEL